MAKNGLANAVKECIVRDADSKTTTWDTAQSGKGNYQGYTLAKWEEHLNCQTVVIQVRLQLTKQNQRQFLY